MTSIKLTEEHKAKLLEMCKELFPKFNEWRYGKVTAEGNLEDFYNKTKNLSWEDKKKYEQSCDFLWIEKDFKYEHDDDIERSETWVIHWFECCCKKLAFQIYNFNIGKTKTTYSSFVAECVIMSTFHPVDYLYDEFKKLKK